MLLGIAIILITMSSDFSNIYVYSEYLSLFTTSGI